MWQKGVLGLWAEPHWRGQTPLRRELYRAWAAGVFSPKAWQILEGFINLARFKGRQVR